MNFSYCENMVHVSSHVKIIMLQIVACILLVFEQHFHFGSDTSAYIYIVMMLNSSQRALPYKTFRHVFFYLYLFRYKMSHSSKRADTSWPQTVCKLLFFFNNYDDQVP